MAPKDPTASANLYSSLMGTVRSRLDLIESIKASGQDSFANCETAAFHARKVVEGVAFGCLVAIEHGLKHVPKDAEGQWNAETIFKNLLKKKIDLLPNPSFLRNPTSEEREAGASNVVVQGVPEKCLTHAEIIKIYQDLHKWLHEVNPYTFDQASSFLTKHKARLWTDISRLNNLIERHAIIISGAGFFCTLRDSVDGQTKVFAFNKLENPS